MRKLLKEIPKSVLSILLFLVLAAALVGAIRFRVKAESLGTSIGEGLGVKVGKLTGSLEALTDYGEAYEEGKEEGLSAEDTTAEIVTKMQEVEKLEVLVASVKLHDEHTIGDDYAALYLLKGDAVFTVDLSEMTVEEESDKLKLILPEPKVELIIDQSKVDKVAEYQRRFFNGSAEDGFDAYLNSMKKIANEPEETISNYEALLETAKQSAQKQIKQLAASVSVSAMQIEIEFQKNDDEFEP